MSETAPILPGATLGMLGGGQLGRMFVMAAKRLGYRVHVLDPNPEAPACQIADEVSAAPYDDLDAVEALARQVDVVTYEFENVPAASAERAAAHAPLRPGVTPLFTAQDRIREKSTLSGLGLPVAPYAAIEVESDLGAALESVGADGVLKTSRSGYDGKGQRRIRSAEDLAPAWDELGRVPCVFEGFVPFESEASVVGARGVGGEVALFELVSNDHANHILDVTLCPAPQAASVHARAAELARGVLEGLDVVGVLCVEFFVMADGDLVINELAPRPHNSGHLTIDAHRCDQFEQQVRAACGLPLGSPERRTPAAAMVNLLGDLWTEGEPRWERVLEAPDARLHLYGKAEARPGRKMGHLTVVGEDAAAVAERARALRDALRR